MNYLCELGRMSSRLFTSLPRGLLAQARRNCVINFATVADDNGPCRKEVVDLAYSWYDEHLSTSPDNLTPLVITHGLLGSKSNWHSIAKALNKQTKRKILTFDLRGHGESPHASNMDYDLMGNDIFKLLTDQGIARAVVLGHSLGGRAMINFALRYPCLVERFICVDISTVQRRTKNPAELYLHEMVNVRFDQTHSILEARKHADRMLSSVVKDISIRQFLLTNVTKDKSGVRWRASLQSFVKNYPNFFNMKTSGKKYDGPALFICGGKSNYILKEDHDAIKTTFPSATFVSIPDAGHWVHADKPLEFIEAVVGFLN